MRSLSSPIRCIICACAPAIVSASSFDIACTAIVCSFDASVIALTVAFAFSSVESLSNLIYETIALPMLSVIHPSATSAMPATPYCAATLIRSSMASAV